MNIPKWLRPLFIFAGLCDGALGLLFLLVPEQLFKQLNAELPGHMGYLQVLALMLLVFALMYFNVAKDPVANRNLIFYGILLKLSFCSVVFYNSFKASLPWVWLFFAIFDIGFISLFLISFKLLNKAKRNEAG